MARRDTRALILETSLALFNERGEARVSTNLIAAESDISPGNLYYHFKGKDEIIVELFKLFLGRLAPLLEPEPDAIPDLERLWLRLHLIFELKGEYRFLYRNLTELTVRIPDLRRAFRALGARERMTLDGMLASLANAGELTLEEPDHAALVDSMMLQVNWWIAFAEVLGDPGLDDGRVQSRAIARTLFLLVPHLSAETAKPLRTLAGAYLEA